MSRVEFDTLQLSRNAFSPRDAARAGDLWRILQDAAVLGSCALGWDPARYRQENCAFVVRRMTVVHRRELLFGEDLAVRTWVSSFRGGRFSNRQVRVDVGGQSIVGATQEWVHITSPQMRITRASPELLAAFAIHDLEPDVELPAVEAESPGAAHLFEFEAWHTWMDPLDHANHPLYVDWLDEALGRALVAAGGDPYALIPVAEQVSWKQGVQAREWVRLESRMVGRTAKGDVVCEHSFNVGDRVCATATTVRGHASGAEHLAAALS